MKGLQFSLLAVGALAFRGEVESIAHVADPKARVEWNGATLYVLTNTPREDPHRCDYTITAVFTDGTKETRKGTTDPPIASTNYRSVTVNFSKQISSGELNRWSCSKKL